MTIVVSVALGVLNLAALLVASQFLEREIRRHSLAVQERVAEAKGALEAVNASLKEVRTERKDASEAVRRIEQLLTEAPGMLSAEEEAAMSKAMEEGISNLLGYSVGKGPGAAT